MDNVLRPRVRHYGQEFAQPPGCFRLASPSVPGAVDAPYRCWLPVSFQGTFTDDRGHTHIVESCWRHRDHLSIREHVEEWANPDF